jgi:hypothetical protein
MAGVDLSATGKRERLGVGCALVHSVQRSSVHYVSFFYYGPPMSAWVKFNDLVRARDAHAVGNLWLLEHA